MISINEFKKRQKALLNYLNEDSIAILFSAPEYIRNGDNHYPYRQNSYFYYLTGFNEPESAAIFVPKRPEGEYILFNRPLNPMMEKWNGPIIGQEGACENFLADQAFSIDMLKDFLPQLLQDRKQIHMLMGYHTEYEKMIWDMLIQLKNKKQKHCIIPTEIINLEDFLSDQRLIKSETEINIMREAAKISAQGHKRAMKACKPGLAEYHLEAELLYGFNSQGSASVAYQSIVGSGKNACILHYSQNNAMLKDNELVLIDAGCELHGYASDITRTFPINGRFSKEQRAIYELVLAAQLAGIEQIYPGNSWEKIQETMLEVLVKGLVELTILKGNISDLLSTRAYLPFYMHSSGHWLGLDVHDTGAYKIKDQFRLLEPGMVLTVEPGLYLSPDASVDPKWWNIGIRIEDDIVVTENGYEILSCDAPKLIDEIESLMTQ
ncbi:MAG: Xaa-Pro aminopeptidase [Legionellaceae bacterium]